MLKSKRSATERSTASSTTRAQQTTALTKIKSIKLQHTQAATIAAAVTASHQQGQQAAALHSKAPRPQANGSGGNHRVKEAAAASSSRPPRPPTALWLSTAPSLHCARKPPPTTPQPPSDTSLQGRCHAGPRTQDAHRKVWRPTGPQVHAIRHPTTDNHPTVTAGQDGQPGGLQRWLRPFPPQRAEEVDMDTKLSRLYEQDKEKGRETTAVTQREEHAGDTTAVCQSGAERAECCQP